MVKFVCWVKEMIKPVITWCVMLIYRPPSGEVCVWGEGGDQASDNLVCDVAGHPVVKFVCGVKEVIKPVITWCVMLQASQWCCVGGGGGDQAGDMLVYHVAGPPEVIKPVITWCVMLMCRPPSGEVCVWGVYLFVCCLLVAYQQHANISQGRICTTLHAATLR